jgi:hypothetical protein
LFSISLFPLFLIKNLYQIGYANSLLHKNATGRKRSRSRSGGLDTGKDDLNYVDEDSDLSSGDDGLNTSDLDSTHHHNQVNNQLADTGIPHQRKRGRPKVHHHRGEDRPAKSSPSASAAAAVALAMASASPYTPPAMPSGYVSDFDESGETKVDKYGRLEGG